MIRCRCHGTSGPAVIVLHGGPAAPGEAAPIARGLADSFTVLEPWQRGSAGATQPLSVARHVADLQELVEEQCPAGSRPALVGESWGAMLALAHAAAHPVQAGPLVLIGCGTFDPMARARLHEILEERPDVDLRLRLQRLPEEIADDQLRLERTYQLTRSLYDFDVIDTVCSEATQREPLDVQAHQETWQDMLRLQEEGVYPAAFSGIASPVLMLHGSHDPHPGRMIRDSLAPSLPQLEYHELARCGHRPWRERHAREEFFTVLRDWLWRRLEER